MPAAPRPDPASIETGSPTRRRRRKAERTPEIIAAGIASFDENGYAETRLEDVAERAGIAKSTIYLYFENKEALFRATVEERVRPVFTELDRAITDYGGDTEGLLRLVLTRAYRRFVEDDGPALLRTILAEGERFPELRRVFYDENLRRGEFRDCPVREYPRLLVAPTLMAGIWRMAFEEFEPIDMQRYAEAHVDLLLHGLKVREDGA